MVENRPLCPLEQIEKDFWEKYYYLLCSFFKHILELKLCTTLFSQSKSLVHFEKHLAACRLPFAEYVVSFIFYQGGSFDNPANRDQRFVVFFYQIQNGPFIFATCHLSPIFYFRVRL